MFRVTHRSTSSHARAGELLLNTPAGAERIQTPVFMPVGTLGTVKAMWHSELEEIGYRLILGNTYHLYLRPGRDLIEASGGLHAFQSWKHGLLTDSGGYQVFSLSDRVKFLDDGVEFASHIDGSRHTFTPESVIDTQRIFGSNIMMVLDDCPPADASAQRLELALERTHRWAKRAIDYYLELHDRGRIDRSRAAIFGIHQGGTELSFRRRSIEAIQSLPFDGIAIGGLSVGESRESMHSTLEGISDLLDHNRPRYLMGVGAIPDLIAAVRAGVDMFDCVLPTRNARNAQLFTSEGKIKIRNREFADQNLPPDPACECRVCRRYSRAYLRHLFHSGEMLGPMLATHHNLFFYFRLLSEMRASIVDDSFTAFQTRWEKIPW